MSELHLVASGLGLSLMFGYYLGWHDGTRKAPR